MYLYITLPYITNILKINMNIKGLTINKGSSKVKYTIYYNIKGQIIEL